MIAALAIESQQLIRVLEAVDYLGDIGEKHAGTVGARQHHEFFIVPAPVDLALGSQQDFSGRGLDGATGQVERGGAHSIRDLVEGQAVSAQGSLRHLERNLVGARIRQRNLGHRWKSRYLVPNALAQDLQGALVLRAREGDVHHGALAFRKRNDRFLGLFWKGIDGIDAVLHIIQRARHVGVFEEFDTDGTDAFAGSRSNSLDTRDPLEFFLHADADTRLHLFRRGAQVLDRDRDQVDIEVGKGLLRHLGEGHESRQHDDAE